MTDSDDRALPATRPRVTPASTWAPMLAASALFWVVVVVEARRMGNGPGTMGMVFPFFLAMWVAMMAAMMWPPLTPLAAATVTPRLRSAAATRTLGVGAFATGFLVAWALYGALIFLVVHRTGDLAASSAGAAKWLGVGILGVAGVYQLTPWKARSLHHCRQVAHAGRQEHNSFTVGMRDGLFCVGCCWVLMAVFVAVGVMNLWAMGGLTLVVASEKLLPSSWALRAARVASAGLLVLAAVASFHPTLLPGLHTVGRGSMGGMHMGG